LTSHREQMRLASRVEPPFSGKNASGSVCEHRARSCHSGALPSRSITTTRSFSIFASLLCAAPAGATPHATPHMLLDVARTHCGLTDLCGPGCGPLVLPPVKLHACNERSVKPNLVNAHLRSAWRHRLAGVGGTHWTNLRVLLHTRWPASLRQK